MWQYKCCWPFLVRHRCLIRKVWYPWTPETRQRTNQKSLGFRFASVHVSRNAGSDCCLTTIIQSKLLACPYTFLQRRTGHIPYMSRSTSLQLWQTPNKKRGCKFCRALLAKIYYLLGRNFVYFTRNSLTGLWMSSDPATCFQNKHIESTCTDVRTSWIEAPGLSAERKANFSGMTSLTHAASTSPDTSCPRLSWP